jgi:hypothetical protein
MGYHYALATAGAAVYGVVTYVTSHRLLAAVEAPSRTSLYTSLAATTAVLLGFAITAVAIFTSLGSGAGLDLLAGEPEFPYARRVMMGAIYTLAVATVVVTILIVADAGITGRKGVEIVAVWIGLLAVLRTWALLWLVNKLLRLAIADRQRARASG